ncbi:TPA: hypothetical protein QIZ58_001116 [Klebsiella aerogenes]|nr:hypothetical protein [Klebsiella aerogenes]
MTTDITELAQREKFEAWAEEVGALPWGMLKKHRNQDGSYPGPHYTYMWKAWQAASAELVEALEKAQQKIIELQQGCENDPRVHEIIDLKERIAELENYAEAEAVGADKAAEDSVYWMKRCKELESRTVTDWIEHDGKWRPDSLSTDELVYLKTRKQELKIPYPAGKVLGWMHTGGDMDVMAYKLASPQARTVTVKLPQRYSMLFREGFSEDYRTEIAYSAEDIQEMLTAAGIKWEAE